MLVSVIVPIYNVEKYLPTCLDSIINQTFKDLQIILVNDGTKDNSQKIIDNYASMDSRIVSLIKENGGLSDARNYGIPYADGEYIFFLDSDDSLELDAIEKLVAKAIKDNNDLVICGYNEVHYNGNVNQIVSNIKTINGGLKENKFILNELPHCAWNKLYKKELFTNTGIRYPKGLYYEDVATSPLIYLEANSIGYLNDCLVNYLVDRPGNITGSVNKKILDIVKDLEIVNEYYRSKDKFEEYYLDLRLFNIKLVFDNLWKMKFVDDQKFVDMMFDDCYSVLDKYFDDWKDDKYFETNGLKNKLIKLIKINKRLYKLYLKRG